MIRVKVIKGGFFKTTAPQAVKDNLAEFYRRLIERGVATVKDVSEVMREMLFEASPHKAFVKKTVDSFLNDKGELKELNKSFHLASLHLAYAYRFPGVAVESERRVGTKVSVRYRVNAVDVLSTGAIVVNYLPTPDNNVFMVYISYDDEKGLVTVHKVKVHGVVMKPKEKEYVVVETWTEDSMSVTELVEHVVRAMRKYIISDVEKMFLPALTKGRTTKKASTLTAFMRGGDN